MAVGQLGVAPKAHLTAQCARQPLTARSTVCMYPVPHINELCLHLREFPWAVQCHKNSRPVSVLTRLAGLPQLYPGALLKSFFTQHYLQHFVPCVMDTDLLCY